MKKSLLITMAVLSLCLSANPQSVLDNLTFEVPMKLVRPANQDGDYVNIRKTPSIKGAKSCSRNFTTILAVEQENASWYKTKDGWISKTVAKPCKNNPITPEMLNRYYGFSTAYDDYMLWTVVPIKGEHELCILYRDWDNFFGYNEPKGLWLGKQIGDVFVFKYHVDLVIEISDIEDTFKLEKLQDEGSKDVYYKLIVGNKYQTKNNLDWDSPDFSIFNEKILERIFKEVIEKNKVDYYYINSELLSKLFAEWQFG